MKYYAVKVGKIPGIYTTWKETLPLVAGYPKAIYKSFPTLAEAEKFISGNEIISDNYVEVYTDGSFKDKKMGYACLTKEDEYFGSVPSVFNSKKLYKSNNVAELYAIYQALINFKGDLLIHTDSIFSVNVLQEGYETTKNLVLIDAIKELMVGRKILLKHVYGHKGNVMNERADVLANMGRE